MREIRPSGSEGGVALITPSLPLSFPDRNAAFMRQQFSNALSRLATFLQDFRGGGGPSLGYQGDDVVIDLLPGG